LKAAFKKGKIIHVLISVIIILNAFSLIQDIKVKLENDGKKEPLNSPEEKSHHHKAFAVQYQAHEPIYINGNTNFSDTAAVESWPGNGSTSNPYTIDGLNISSGASIYLIEIQNTTVHFQITNCYLLNGIGIGIYFNNVTNGRITNITISQNFGGIYLSKSDDNTLANNTLNNNEYGGITLDCSVNNTLISNTLNDNNDGGIDSGISLFGSDDNTLINNTLSKNNNGGITLDHSVNNTLSNNTLYRNDDYGIDLVDSNDNTIVNNTISRHDNAGIALDNSTNNILVNNNFYWDGIALDRSANNTLINNILNKNGLSVYGWTIEECFQKTVAGNKINDKPLIFWQNKMGGTVPLETGQIVLINVSAVTIRDQDLSYASIGIEAMFSHSLEIYNNTLSNGGNGIYLRNTANITIINNYIYDNYDGIYLYHSDNTTLANNALNNNGQFGIRLAYSANNTITNNSVNNNDEHGITLDGSANNTITRNNFVGNNHGGVQAWDGAGTDNIFSYNYWNDWISPDSDEDGIVDVPYDIEGYEGGNVDDYPVTTPHELGVHFLIAPRITYPTGGEILSGTVTVQWDAAMDSLEHTIIYTVSYSIDGGNTWTILAMDVIATSYNWDTTTVTNGFNYLIQVNASCSEGLWQVDRTDYIFTIDNYIAHTLSIPTITSPNGGEIITGTTTIQWNTATDSWGHIVNYNISYSGDGGTTWVILESGLMITSYAWDTTTVEDDSDYLIQVTASCSEGLLQVDTSDSTFTIHNQITTTPVSTTEPSTTTPITTTTITRLSSSAETTTTEPRTTVTTKTTTVASRSAGIIVVIMGVLVVITITKRQRNRRR
jgi:parallel beta-helix repeat protein